MRRLALAAHLERSIRRRDEAVLARVAHVSRPDQQRPRRDAWCGRTGTVVQKMDEEFGHIALNDVDARQNAVKRVVEAAQAHEVVATEVLRHRCDLTSEWIDEGPFSIRI